MTRELGRPPAGRRRPHRPLARRRLLPRQVWPVPAPPPALSDLERRKRLDRVAAYLVRTMRACPAPGIAPLTTRDWLLIAGVVVLPYLLVFSLAAIAPTLRPGH